MCYGGRHAPDTSRNERRSATLDLVLLKEGQSVQICPSALLFALLLDPSSLGVAGILSPVASENLVVAVLRMVNLVLEATNADMSSLP